MGGYYHINCRQQGEVKRQLEGGGDSCLDEDDIVELLHSSTPDFGRLGLLGPSIRSLIRYISDPN